MAWLAPAVVAVAVSLDGLLVGASYGLRRVALPASSLAIIGAMSTLLAGLATAFGGWASVVLRAAVAGRAGGIVLVLLGLSVTWRTWRQRRGHGPASPSSPPRPLLSLRLRLLGLIVQVWRDPSGADVDRSGRLEGLEAATLGVCLAADAIAAGVGLALNGGGFLFAALVGPLQAAFVKLGARAGGRVGRVDSPVIVLAPGGILLAVGLLRLL